MKYLKQFIIGTSFPVVVGFFIGVYNYTQKIKKNDPEYYNSLSEKEIPFFWKEIWPKKYNYYSYFRYTITAPLFFGIFNIISLIIAEYFGLTMRNRFIIISIISSIFLTTWVYIYNIYDYTTIEQYIKYYISIFIVHMLVWNVVIYNLEKHI